MGESAVKTKNPEKLKQSIHQARDVGMAQHEISEAEFHLQKHEAQEALRAAVKQKDACALSDTIQAAHKSGVGFLRICNANTLRNRILAERELAESTATNEATVMSSAIANAREAGVTKSEVDKVEASLDRLRRASSLQELVPGSPRLTVDEAKRLIDSRRVLETAVHSNNAEKLRFSLSQAKEVGMAQSEMSQAEYLLVKIELREALSSAITSQDIPALQDSLERARLADLYDVRVGKASALLERLVAQRELDTVASCGDRERIVSAIWQARAARLPQRDIERAQALLEEPQVLQQTGIRKTLSLPSIAGKAATNIPSSLRLPRGSAPSSGAPILPTAPALRNNLCDPFSTAGSLS